VRNEAAGDGSGPARESIWQYFVNKCAANLHIALSMSPVGDTLRNRCRNFPGLATLQFATRFTAARQSRNHDRRELWACAVTFTALCYASAVLATAVCPSVSVSVSVSVTSQCSIETAERIELVLARELPSTRPTRC